MPINDLLARHQLAQLHSTNAATDEERTHFADLESVYAIKIGAWREALALPGQGWPGVMSAAILPGPVGTGKFSPTPRVAG